MNPRASIKQQRAELHPDEVALASAVIAEKLLKLYSLLRAHRIACYMPANGEVDCTVVLDSAKLRKKRFFLPVLRSNTLLFAPVDTGTEMHRNRFGILEPVYQNGSLQRGSDMDVVIAPLVAFDQQCNRLGMGGGYYDRAFALRNRRSNWRKPLLIGVAYSFQRIEQIEPQAWDVPLDVVVTEQQTYRRR